MLGWYAVSKAALIHLTTELGHQLGPQVRVNAVAPAVVKTQFASALYEGREEEVAAAYPMKRLGVPEDVAGAVSFLLSADAGWITGQTLVVDGGVTLGGAPVSRFDGQVVVVTGGGRGIGAAYARMFARRGRRRSSSTTSTPAPPHETARGRRRRRRPR